MNELRLEYHRDTGKRINWIIEEGDIAEAYLTGSADECDCEAILEITNWTEAKAYIEWLENKFGPGSIGERALAKQKWQKILFNCIAR